MPSKSEAQKRTMQAAAHNPQFAKKVGIPEKVAKEFTAADKSNKKKLPEKVGEKNEAPPARKRPTK